MMSSRQYTKQAATTSVRRCRSETRRNSPSTAAGASRKSTLATSSARTTCSKSCSTAIFPIRATSGSPSSPENHAERSGSAALERLPALAKGFVTVDAGGGPYRREAITEAALYALAFDRRDLLLAGPAATGGAFPYDTVAHTDALALCYQIKTLETYFQSVRNSISLGTGLADSPAFQNFERAILHAAQAADLQIGATPRS